MYRIFIKRLIDIILALILLVISSPILFFTSVLLFVFNKGNIFFYQLRPGKKGKIFRIWKFKTMTDVNNEQGNLLPDYKRITTIGKFIRGSSIDELPQLFNVLKGEMSLIGPRPLLIEYLPLYSERQKKRHSVRPGITGSAQVNGRNTLTWSKKFEYDVWYVENLSWNVDVKIFFLTIRKVFVSDGINQGEDITMGKFKGNN